MDRFSYNIYKRSLLKRLIRANDKIIVSVSGGGDSVALFVVLMDFMEKMDLTLHMAHFHHGLRKESDHEEESVRNLAQKYTIPLTVFHSTDFLQVKGVQEKARSWRKKNLLELRSKLNFDHIALGHHQDDLIETQIWKIARGCSLFALKGISPKSGRFIRPLLYTPKMDLLHFLKRRNISWCEDSSNLDNVYTRNIIRNEILPLMEKISGDRLRDKLTGLANDAVQLEQAFVKTAKKGYTEETLSYTTINDLSPPFAQEFLHRFLLEHGQIEITRANIEKIISLVNQKKGNWSISLKHGKKILGKRGNLYLL